MKSLYIYSNFSISSEPEINDILNVLFTPPAIHILREEL